jgi:hypothetical protein
MLASKLLAYYFTDDDKKPRHILGLDWLSDFFRFRFVKTLFCMVKKTCQIYMLGVLLDIFRHQRVVKHKYLAVGKHFWTAIYMVIRICWTKVNFVFWKSARGEFNCLVNKMQLNQEICSQSEYPATQLVPNFVFDF